MTFDNDNDNDNDNDVNVYFGRRYELRSSCLPDVCRP